MCVHNNIDGSGEGVDAYIIDTYVRNTTENHNICIVLNSIDDLRCEYLAD